MTAHYTHFVWLSNTRGGVDAQLWSQDWTQGVAPGGNYRADCPYHISEKVVRKVVLPPEDGNIDLNAAKAKYPYAQSPA